MFLLPHPLCLLQESIKCALNLTFSYHFGNSEAKQPIVSGCTATRPTCFTEYKISSQGSWIYPYKGARTLNALSLMYFLYVINIYIRSFTYKHLQDEFQYTYFNGLQHPWFRCILAANMCADMADCA